MNSLFGFTQQARRFRGVAFAWAILSALVSLFGCCTVHAQGQSQFPWRYYHMRSKIPYGLTLDPTQVMVTDLSAASNGGMSDALNTYLSGLQFTTTNMTNNFSVYWLVPTPISAFTTPPCPLPAIQQIPALRRIRAAMVPEMALWVQV